MDFKTTVKLAEMGLRNLLNPDSDSNKDVQFKKGPQHRQAHRGITRKKQNWVPDFHKITRDDIVNQKVEKSKEDNIARVLSDLEVLRACDKYNIDVKNIKNGSIKEHGTSKTKIWYDGIILFIQGTKKGIA